MANQFNILDTPSGGAGTANDVAQARRTTSLLLTTAFADISLDATDIETDSAVIDHEAGTPDRITLQVAGTYKIEYDMDIDPGNVATSTAEIQARVRVDDTTIITGSEAETTVFFDASIDGSEMTNHLSKTVIFTATAGQFITLQALKVNVGDVPNPSLRAGGTTVVVTRLK